MPRRLLRQPHLLAHELRTPLGILAGWVSLIREGDIHPERTPRQWASAMEACDEAATRLNLIIKEACYEADEGSRFYGVEYERFSRLLESTRDAMEQSQRVLVAVRRTRNRG